MADNIRIWKWFPWCQCLRRYLRDCLRKIESSILGVTREQHLLEAQSWFSSARADVFHFKQTVGAGVTGYFENFTSDKKNRFLWAIKVSVCLVSLSSFAATPFLTLVFINKISILYCAVNQNTNNISTSISMTQLLTSSLCSSLMCRLRLLTVESCFPQMSQEVWPVWILLWFLKEPGFLKTLPQTLQGKCWGMADGG